MDWAKKSILTFTASDRNFRFGDSKLIPSLGTYNIPLVLSPEHTNQTSRSVIIIRADVVESMAPLLISKKSLVAMHGRLDFQHSQLEIENGLTIRLRNLPSGHISIPASPEKPKIAHIPPHSKIPVRGTYPTCIVPTLLPVTDAQILKIHRRLAHCSEFAMSNLLRTGGRTVNKSQIKRVLRNCVRKGAVGRVTPPKVTGSKTRFNGEIVAIDAIYPFVGGWKKEYPAKTFWHC